MRCPPAAHHHDALTPSFVSPHVEKPAVGWVRMLPIVPPSPDGVERHWPVKQAIVCLSAASLSDELKS